MVRGGVAAAVLLGLTLPPTVVADGGAPTDTGTSATSIQATVLEGEGHDCTSCSDYLAVFHGVRAQYTVTVTGTTNDVVKTAALPGTACPPSAPSDSAAAWVSPSEGVVMPQAQYDPNEPNIHYGPDEGYVQFTNTLAVADPGEYRLCTWVGPPGDAAPRATDARRLAVRAEKIDTDANCLRDRRFAKPYSALYFWCELGADSGTFVVEVRRTVLIPKVLFRGGAFHVDTRHGRLEAVGPWVEVLKQDIASWEEAVPRPTTDKTGDAWGGVMARQIGRAPDNRGGADPAPHGHLINIPTAISVWCGGRSPWYYYLRARYLGSPSAGPLPLNWKKVTLGSTSGCGAKQPPGVEAFAHKEIQRLYLKRLRHH